MTSLNPSQIRALKAMAQRLEASLQVGKNGLSDPFVRSVDEALALRELVKVRFLGFKEQKQELAALLAVKTSSHLVARVGHVVVLYREQPDPARRLVQLEPGSGPDLS